MQFPHKFAALAAPKSCAASVMSFNHNWFSVWARLPVINATRFMPCNKLARQIMTTVASTAEFIFQPAKSCAALQLNTRLLTYSPAKSQEPKANAKAKKSRCLPQKLKVFGIFPPRISHFIFSASVCKYLQIGQSFTMETRGLPFVSQRCVHLTTV